MSSPADWQKAIREAQTQFLRAAEQMNAEEARKAAEKNAADGANLAKVLSKLFGIEISPLPTNVWVSPDGIHFAFQYKTDWDGGKISFSESLPRGYDKLCWWFNLIFWKPSPEKFQNEFAGTSGFVQATSHDIDGDWQGVRADIAMQIDRIHEDWEREVKRIEATLLRPQRQSTDTIHLGLPEQLYTVIYEIVQDVVANQYRDY